MKGKKIAILGPVYPYKGGIAHYTSLLCRQLSKYNKVWMFSYRLQYPKRLYPGGDQIDYENDVFKVNGTKFILNTVNPVSYYFTAKEIRKRKPDLCIIQWWHPFFSPAYLCIAKLLRKHVTILFVCHNVLPHDPFPFSRFLTKQTLKSGHCYVIHSEKDELDLRALLAAPICQKHVLPAFHAFSQQKMSMGEARKQLDIEGEKQVLLFFGFVRRYKGLKYILNAMPEIIRQLPECQLLVAGDFFGSDKDEYMAIIKKLSICGRVRIFDGYIPDHEVEKYFAASNLAVLPYESATQSGIVQIAFSFGLPVIVTEVGGLPEAVNHGKTGYVVPPFDSRMLGEIIVQYFKQGKEEEFRENIRKEAGRFSWGRMESVIGELYEKTKREQFI